ncbi:hypothetical protein HPB52_018929 [Rhipicephalus sanguineus]|uniref:Uncharacterized protein n=1 Tax=Rhipicephalus sanguineus TaxID=34632 RepID=A0A9D4TB88_RHISA|nr:hypothetical protein HPB52_018929 [Rhipicephalus sanguineus]
MGRDVPSGTGIKRKFDDTAAARSGESPSYKTPSSMFFVANSLDTSDDVSYVSSALAIEDGLSDNRSSVNMQWKKAGGRVSGAGHRGMFQRAARDLLLDTGAKDTACHCNAVHQTRTFQETRHQPMSLSRGTGRPYIRSAKKPSTGPLEVGMSTNLEVVEGGAADAADSLGDLARHQRICLLCTLPCLLAEAGYPKQQHLEATIALTPAVFSATVSLHVCGRAGAVPPGARGGRL